MADFNQKCLPGKKLAIACPKLDSQPGSYLAKLTALIDEAQVNTITVMIMEVPCCGGLLRTAQAAAEPSPKCVDSADRGHRRAGAPGKLGGLAGKVAPRSTFRPSRENSR